MNLTAPRIQFNISSSPSSNTLDLFCIQFTSQQIISTVSSDYLGSTTYSEKTCENPFDLPTSSQRFPHSITQKFSQSEPTLVSDPTKISSVKPLSLPETLFLPSTPSVVGHIPSAIIPHNFPRNLDKRYREVQDTTIQLRSDWFGTPL